jgi:hypothetical protein
MEKEVLFEKQIASVEIPRLLWGLGVLWFSKEPVLDPILNRVHTVTSFVFQINLNIFPSSMPRSTK